jgi:hypothetical protein
MLEKTTTFQTNLLNMKYLLILATSFFSFATAFAKSSDSSTIILTSGLESKCIVVSADPTGVTIQTDAGNINRVDSRVISTIDGLSFQSFYEAYLKKLYQEQRVTAKSFNFQLEKGGTLIAVGTGLTLAAAGLTTFAALSDKDQPIFYYVSAGLSLSGALMIMSGGISIAKAGRTYKDQSLGYKGNYSIQYGLLPSGAGVRLRL